MNEQEKIFDTCMRCIIHSLFLTQTAETVGAIEKEDFTVVTYYDIAVQLLFCSLLHKYNVDIIAEEEENDLYRQIIKKIETNTSTNIIEDVVNIDKICSYFKKHRISVKRLKSAQKSMYRQYKINIIVDPIDGTKGFIKGRIYSIVVSAILNDSPLFSIIASPHENRIFYRVRNSKYFFRDNPKILLCAKNFYQTYLEFRKTLLLQIAVSAEGAHSGKILQRYLEEIKKLFPVNLRQIDGQCKYAYLAAKEIDIFVRLPASKIEEKIWDHCAGVHLCKECTVTDAYGNPLLPHSPPEYGVLASHSEKLHRISLEIIRNVFKQ